MITIGNKRKGDVGHYCGRPSPLGNPFSLLRYSRDEACDRYENWFHSAVARGDRLVMQELRRLQEMHEIDGDLTLLCWCVPERCHCETIKRYLDEQLGGK